MKKNKYKNGLRQVDGAGLLWDLRYCGYDNKGNWRPIEKRHAGKKHEAKSAREKLISDNKSRKEVEQAAQKIRGVSRTNPSAISATITFGEWNRFWLDDKMKNQKPLSAVMANKAKGDVGFDKRYKTVERYDELIGYHINPSIGHILLKDLTAKIIADFYSKLRNSGKLDARKRNFKPELGKPFKAPPTSGLEEATVLSIDKVLAASLRKAHRTEVREGSGILYMQREIMPDVENRPKHSEVKRIARMRMRVLNSSETSELFQGLTGHWIYPIVFLKFATGMRLSELGALKIGDVDPIGKRIIISKALERTAKWGLRVKDTKTGSPRSVYIDDNVLLVIKKHVEDLTQTAREAGITVTPKSFLFPRSIYLLETPKPSWSITQCFSAQTEKILGFKMKLHSLRHTHASQLLHAGVSPVEIKDRLGHTETTTTLDIYSHLLDQRQERIVKVTSELINAALGFDGSKNKGKTQ